MVYGWTTGVFRNGRLETSGMGSNLLDMDNGQRRIFYRDDLGTGRKVQEGGIPYTIFFINKARMGNHSAGFQPGREQHNGVGLHVLRSSEYYHLPTPKKSMEAKIIGWIFTGLFVGGYPLAVWWNLGSWKSFILFLIMAAWGIAKLYYYCVRQNQRKRLTELEIKERERDLDKDIFS